jgi:hypothetical protein
MCVTNILEFQWIESMLLSCLYDIVKVALGDLVSEA